MNYAAELNNPTRYVKTIKAQLASAHSSPKEYLRQNAATMDGLVRKTFQAAQLQVSSPSVCLVAVGGYGRAELAPFSDVDLLLLYDSSKKEQLSLLVEKLLYPLWDSGLEVTCSSRSIKECLNMARSDLYIKTALIDGRFLDGEYEFFRKFYDSFSKKILHRSVREFASALAKDLFLRRQKYIDPVYTLEPNLKEGEGGLRDFQAGRWLIRAKYRTDRWDSLLFPDHSRMLDKSLEFLWAVRNQLHHLSGRKQDNLTFEFQERIAPELGFLPGTEGVEEMMRQYHLATQRISNFAQDILGRVLHEPSWFNKISCFFRQKKIDKNYRITNGEIHLLSPATFKRDPTQLMTLFKHSQTYASNLDFRTEEAVLEVLPFIDDRFRASKRVTEVFLSILREGKRVDALLKKMYELGFLSRYIPEFSDIEGKVHYDLYHVHPVGQHSLLAVEELVKLYDGLYRKDYPLLTILIQEVEKPEILFLTSLLHDIGKGAKGNHCLAGEEMVRRIGERMELSAGDRELIQFLVRHHLLMVEIAFRRDLQDEQVILRFAGEVRNLNQLKMLYLLTFADVRAVGPEAWTSWKNELLMELFLKTSHFFEKGASAGLFPKRDEVTRVLRESLSPELFSQFVDHLPDRYLSCYSIEEILHHIKIAEAIEGGILRVEWTTEEERRAKVTVCTKDRYGLFSKITRSMFLNRLNILEAQVHTWENGVALDTFWVEDMTGEIERRLQEFKFVLENILIEKQPLKDPLPRKNESNGMKPKVIPRVSGGVKVNNLDSDFYTIVEVTAEDRLGILYEMAEALTNWGCNIHFARISTLGNRVVDVFYVQDEWGEKIDGKEKVDHLQQALLRRLTPHE